MRDQHILGWMGAVVLALLCGCAANTRSSAAAEESDFHCSFRSPTTCWTVSGRFPAVRSKARTAPSAVLASAADSAGVLKTGGSR